MAVVPAVDPVQMKVSNKLGIDGVHVRDLDWVGSITADAERVLPKVPGARLQELHLTE